MKIKYSKLSKNMEEIAKNILRCIEKFNIFLNNQILSNQEIKEEEDNFKDFIATKNN